jgi:hypothetical protein
MFQARYGLKPGNQPGAWDGYGTRIQNLEVVGNTFVSGPLTRGGINIGRGPEERPIQGVFRNNLFVLDVMKNDNAEPFRVLTGRVRFEDNAWTIPVPTGLPASNVTGPASALVNPAADLGAGFSIGNYRPLRGGPLDGAGYGALVAVGEEPSPPPPPDPEPEPGPDWPALRALAAEVTAETATAYAAADKAVRLMQTLDNRLREYELAAQGGEE